MKLFKLIGNHGWLIYSCWDLNINDAENVYKNHFDKKAIMKRFYRMDISYPNILISGKETE